MMMMMMMMMMMNFFVKYLNMHEALFLGSEYGIIWLNMFE